MKISLLLISITISLCVLAQKNTKESIQNDLIGTWVMTGSNDEYFRYVKSNELKKNTRGFIFSEDGKVIIYGEFGCQLPPHFKPWNGSWEVKSKRIVLIDRHYPGEEAERMKIKKLNGRVLKFEWD